MRISVLTAFFMLMFTSSAFAASTCWVKLWDDAGYTDRELTIPCKRDMGDFNHIHSDDGKKGFNDKASSAKWHVPDGWKLVLYENHHYAKRKMELKGKGENPDFGWFNDKPSSARWERLAPGE